MAGQTLFDKIWNRHVVTEKHGQTLLYIDRHLLHDGSFFAFNELRKKGLTVRRPEQTFATPDHYTPTHTASLEDLADPRAKASRVADRAVDDHVASAQSEAADQIGRLLAGDFDLATQLALQRSGELLFLLRHQLVGRGDLHVE